MTPQLAKLIRLVPILAFVSLSACGGGGGSSDGTPVSNGIEAYSGTWKTCAGYVLTDGSAIYTNETMTFNKIGSVSASLTSTWLNLYEGENCSKIKSAHYSQFTTTVNLVKTFSLLGLNGHQATETDSSGHSRTQYIAVDESGKNLYWGAGDVQSNPPTGWSAPYARQ